MIIWERHALSERAQPSRLLAFLLNSTARPMQAAAGLHSPASLNCTLWLVPSTSLHYATTDGHTLQAMLPLSFKRCHTSKAGGEVDTPNHSLVSCNFGDPSQLFVVRRYGSCTPLYPVFASVTLLSHLAIVTVTVTVRCPKVSKKKKDTAGMIAHGHWRGNLDPWGTERQFGCCVPGKLEEQGHYY